MKYLRMIPDIVLGLAVALFLASMLIAQDEIIVGGTERPATQTRAEIEAVEWQGVEAEIVTHALWQVVIVGDAIAFNGLVLTPADFDLFPPGARAATVGSYGCWYRYDPDLDQTIRWCGWINGVGQHWWAAVGDYRERKQARLDGGWEM